MSSSFSTESSIHGHHIYKDIWTPQVDERLYCKVGNIHDPYAVAVKRPNDNTVVGHVPHKVSAVCCFFLRRGSITCVVTGSCRHSSDLPQGGLEVPGADASKEEDLSMQEDRDFWERGVSILSLEIQSGLEAAADINGRQLLREGLRSPKICSIKVGELLSEV